MRYLISNIQYPKQPLQHGGNEDEGSSSPDHTATGKSHDFCDFFVVAVVIVIALVIVDVFVLPSITQHHVKVKIGLVIVILLVNVLVVAANNINNGFSSTTSRI